MTNGRKDPRQNWNFFLTTLHNNKKPGLAGFNYLTHYSLFYKETFADHFIRAPHYHCINALAKGTDI